MVQSPERIYMFREAAILFFSGLTTKRGMGGGSKGRATKEKEPFFEGGKALVGELLK